MLIHAAEPLFAWAELEDSPTLSTLRDVLQAVPDQALLDGLVAARGHGRDDYPVQRLWGVVLLTIALRPMSFNACLAELHRNPSLCRFLGITCEEQIPNDHNLSRFLDVLGQEPHLSALRQVFDDLARRLGRVITDLGRHTAGDATTLNARPKGNPKVVLAERQQGLPQPSGGRKEYRDDSGQVTQVVEWFGYKLHVLVDVRHEIALAYHVSDPKAGDNERIGTLLEQAQANLPEDRIQTLAYDKAADDAAVHDLLHRYRIKPLIQNRALWQTEPERVLPGGRYPLNLVHDEAGTVHCYDQVSDPPVRHRMAYLGYESDRGPLKYRCPARAIAWTVNNLYNESKTDAAELVELIAPTTMAAHLAGARAADAYAWGYLLGRLWLAATQAWRERLKAALPRKEIESLIDRFQPDESGGLSELLGSLGAIDLDFGEACLDRAVGVLSLAFARDPIAALRETHDLQFQYLGLHPFTDRKPTRRERSVSTKILDGLKPETICEGICTRRFGEWRNYAELLSWVRRDHPTKHQSIVATIDWNRLGARMEALWKKPPLEMQRLLFSFAHGADGGPVRGLIERHANAMEEMDPLLALISPEAAVGLLRAGKNLHLFAA